MINPFSTYCSDPDERVLCRPLRVCEEVDLRVDVDLLRRFRATPANVTCFQNVLGLIFAVTLQTKLQGGLSDRGLDLVDSNF